MITYFKFVFSLSKLLGILFVILTISIPVSVNSFLSFSSDVTVSLGDLLDDHTDEDDKCPTPFAELEEVETEALTLHASMFSDLPHSLFEITHQLKSFIPSYVFSIFIPPSR